MGAAQSSTQQNEIKYPSQTDGKGHPVKTGPNIVSIVGTIVGLLPLFVVPILLGGFGTMPNVLSWRSLGALASCALLGGSGAMMGLMAFTMGNRGWGIAAILISIVCAAAGIAFTLSQ